MGIRTKYFTLTQINIASEAISQGEDSYYVYAGHPNPWPDDANPPAVFESINESVYQTESNLLFGKKIMADNLRMMARRVDWAANTSYDQYSHLDDHLFDKNFYVITDEHKCYKVLSNNADNVSMIKPTLTQNNAFTTSDGYVWKYMFSVSDIDMTRFATPTHFPVATNANTENSATSGIDVVELLSSGQGYLCYVNGTVQSVLSDKILQIDNYASQDNDFYTKSAFYVTAGPALGELRNITKYVANTTGNFVYLDDSIGAIPVLTKYRIAPAVRIAGDGTGAKAICSVSENYGIANVQIIAAGSGYTRASAIISTNTAYGAGANVQAYVPPPGGHGAYPSYELGADTFGINIIFNGDEANTIPTYVSYRRYGILKNPKKFDGTSYTANTFSNIMSISTSPALTFSVGELIKSDDSLSQAYVVASNSTATMLVGDKSFEEFETLIAANGITTVLSSINDKGDIDPTSSSILYINNSSPILRVSNGSETVKILFTF